MANNKKPVCEYCKNKFTGCHCNIKKANNGKPVHARCLQKYNAILKMIEQQVKENEKE